MIAARGAVLAALSCAAALGLAGCLPAAFDALADAAPARTVSVKFPGDATAELALALTVAADDEGRGRVLFGDGSKALGWMRVDGDGSVGLRYAHFGELLELGGASEPPTLTGLAVVPDAAVAEGLLRVAASEDGPERVVRFRVADFSRIEAIEDDMFVYPWVADPAPLLTGALAVVQLDDGLPEALCVSSEGVLIWDALGTKRLDYAQARAALLADDPSVFDAAPEQGFGLTRCVGLMPTAIAGGAVGADGGRAALALSGASLTMIAVADPPQLSLIGAPIYDCGAATLELPGTGSSLAVVDLGLDGDDDLLVGSASERAVWVYENTGAGLPTTPSMVLEGEGDELEFAASLTTVELSGELGGDAPEVIVVGAPMTTVDGRVGVGRVLVYDAGDGTLLKVIEDLEPRTNSHHGLGVHGLDLPGREELVVSGAPELRVHWSILPGDEGPAR